MLARLMEFREIAPLVRHFVFEAEGQTLKFLPGQFVSFVANVGGKEITRAYSLASAPGPGNRFELCLNVVPEGKLTPHLFAMRPGDTISMTLWYDIDAGTTLRLWPDSAGVRGEGISSGWMGATGHAAPRTMRDSVVGSRIGDADPWRCLR